MKATPQLVIMMKLRGGHRPHGTVFHLDAGGLRGIF
jgi:hypothetical protein